jgi:hypothetical protein
MIRFKYLDLTKTGDYTNGKSIAICSLYFTLRLRQLQDKFALCDRKLF